MKTYVVAVKRSRGAGGIYGKPLVLWTARAESADEALQQAKKVAWATKLGLRTSTRFGFEVVDVRSDS